MAVAVSYDRREGKSRAEHWTTEESLIQICRCTRVGGRPVQRRPTVEATDKNLQAHILALKYFAEHILVCTYFDPPPYLVHSETTDMHAHRRLHARTAHCAQPELTGGRTQTPNIWPTRRIPAPGTPLQGWVVSAHLDPEMGRSQARRQWRHGGSGVENPTLDFFFLSRDDVSAI